MDDVYNLVRFLYADNHIEVQSKSPKKQRDILNNLGNSPQKKYDTPVLRSRKAVHATSKDECSNVDNNSQDVQV